MGLVRRTLGQGTEYGVRYGEGGALPSREARLPFCLVPSLSNLPGLPLCLEQPFPCHSQTEQQRLRCGAHDP